MKDTKEPWFDFDTLANMVDKVNRASLNSPEEAQTLAIAYMNESIEAIEKCENHAMAAKIKIAGL